MLLLDEPTAGLSQRETEAFAPRIGEIQRALGAAILLIEHDMPLVMSVSDRVYCLEAGVVIAEGTPAEVRADPLVIASYLGAEDGRWDHRLSARHADRTYPSHGDRSALGHRDLPLHRPRGLDPFVGRAS